VLISRSPLPGTASGGIGRGEVAQGFNPFPTPGITRVSGVRFLVGAVLLPAAYARVGPIEGLDNRVGHKLGSC